MDKAITFLASIILQAQWPAAAIVGAAISRRDKLNHFVDDKKG